MGTPLEQLTTARADITRLTGIESQFNALMAQIPGGDVASLTSILTEHGQFREQVASLSAEVGTLTTRATTAEGEVSRLTGELETVRASVDQRAEDRAAEIVANSGNQGPAKADVTGAGGGAVKAAAQRTGQEHWEHYSTLSAEDKNAYYRANLAAMTK